MKLSSLHIDGFGPLAGLDLDDIDPGLVVVLGPNEAGKSTLFDFLIGALFGFPARKADPRYHAPIRGGRHGGRLGFVDDGGGTWVVERHTAPRREVRIWGPQGMLTDEAALVRALAGANASLFRTVFAIGLDDLGQMGELDNAEVRELLFAASIFGQRRSATQAMRALEEERGALARPRQGDARANRLAARLEDVRRQLAEARTQAAGYGELRRMAEEAESALAGHRELLSGVRARKQDIGLLRSCWEPYRLAEASRRELAAWAAPAPRLLDDAGVLEELGAECSGHSERLAQLQALRRQRHGLVTSIGDRLSRLGERWTADRVSAMTEPAVLEEAVRSARDGIRAATTALAERTAVARDHERLLDACLGGDQPPGGEPPTLAEIERSAGDAAELRERLNEIESLKSEMREAAAASAVARAAIAGPRAETTVAGAGSAAAVALLAGGALVTVLGVVLALTSAVAAGAATVAIGIALGALGARLLILLRHAGNAGGVAVVPDATPREPGGSAGTGETEVETVHLLRLARERSVVLATGLGLPVPPSRIDVDRYTSALQHARDERRRLDDDRATRTLAARRLAESRSAVALAESDLESLEHRHAEWCLVHDLEVKSPDETLEQLSELAEARARLFDLRRLEIALREAEGVVTAYEDRVASFRASLDPSIEATLPGLGSAPTEAAGFVTAALGMLANEKNVEEARQSLVRSLKEAEDSIDRSLGQGETATRLQKELSAGDAPAWALEDAVLGSEISQLEQEEERLVRQHQSLTEEMGRLAASDRIAELSRQEEAIETELAVVLQRFVVLGTARALLARTLSLHEQERQPKVVSSAAERFARVTGGRYESLVAVGGSSGSDPGVPGSSGALASGGATLFARSASGEMVDTSALSRGTIEQLYLCLRLGLADSFAERSVTLPIVLDDVLVNFDPERASAVADELASAADRHQVVMFTCHPHLAAMMMHARRRRHPAAQLIRLGRLGEAAADAEQLALAALTALPDPEEDPAAGAATKANDLRGGRAGEAGRAG